MLNIDGHQDSLLLHAGFRNITYDTLFTGIFDIKETIVGGQITSAITLSDSNGETDYLFKNALDVNMNGVQIHFTEDGLILDKQKWEVKPENFLQLTDTGIFSQDFVFKLAKQRIGFEASENEYLISVQNFELSNLLNILKKPDQNEVFKGCLHANIVIPSNKRFEGISADLSLTDFYFFETLAGDVHFDLTERQTDLDVRFSLVNKANSLSVSGIIAKSDYPQPVHLNVAVDIENPGWFELFSLGEISQTQGSITGKMQVDGLLNDLLIDGFVNFKNARMKINQLNLVAELRDETIRFDKSGIIFDNFTTYDANSKKLVVNGTILTENYADFAFDLQLNAKDFQAVNSTKKDNPTIYGSFIFDADVFLKGNIDLPKVDASFTIKEGTDLTYVMPGSEIEMISSEGIVHFINPNQGIDSIFRVEQSDFLSDSIISKFRGIDLNAKVELDPKAKFTLIIDPHSGDYASVSGSAVLNFSYDQGGSQTLTGVFEVSDGIYQLSFYGLVKKAFAFQPGSTIAWSGNVMDANMNFTALHVVKTQSVALVANESTGMTEAEKNMFKQRLPYEVMLNLKGFLSEPNVGFSISLPEKYLVNYPAISSKLTMLNSGQNNSELNKQVFALLVTGSFIADSPFVSTGGGAESFATTAARNSVNGILADQLNKMSGRYIKAVDLNFGLTSYEDFSGDGSQTRTELDVQVSKKLLNDRLTVEASGSFNVEGNRQFANGSTSNTYGEFSATYDLTENREYKLRAYRENAYDLFDGEVTYSGLAFIIEKSFDSLFKRKKEHVKSSGQQTKED